jgi:hypothetical protein
VANRRENSFETSQRLLLSLMDNIDYLEANKKQNIIKFPFLEYRTLAKIDENRKIEF